MTTNVAIIGLGIMGTRMLQHMRKHQEFNPNYLWDPSPIACETAVLAKLENKDGLPVNIFASIGGVQPDRQEFTIKGSKKSRKVAEFYKDSVSVGENFIPLRE